MGPCPAKPKASPTIMPRRIYILKYLADLDIGVPFA
jgi:hypothetical protein